MTIKTKSGADLRDLHVVMRVALVATSLAWASLGHASATITATGDGQHSPGSVHPFGFAFDVRTWRKGMPGVQWPMAKKEKAAEKLRAILPHGFHVVVETTHIHIELDPQWIWKLFHPNVPREFFV